MSWSWYIYSEKSAHELVAVGEAYDAALEEFPGAEQADEDELADAGPGGAPVPTPAQLVAYRAQFGERVPAELLERLPRCRSTMEFAYVRAQPQESPLQVSALRFWLTQLAPCLMDWGDLSVELGEDALHRLQRLRSRGKLGAHAAPLKVRPPIKKRAARPGELRAARILARLRTAREGDRDAAHDVQRAAQMVSEPARRYLEMLIEDGPCSDSAAARRLRLTQAVLRTAADELATALD